jgi:permuted papain-like amidase YaeF/Yiix C92 family enzyme
MALLRLLGRFLARYLSQPRLGATQIATNQQEKLAATLIPGDILLVESNTQISVAIKYLTQSSWSHAALYVGNVLGSPAPGQEAKVLIEADLNAGVQAIPLSKYSGLHTRICRPVGLSKEEIDKVIAFMVSRLGYQYDLKHFFDLARYLIPTPPVPTRWRRRMIAFGSGDPTRAICSSLIAQAFQSIRYPILPHVVFEKSTDPACTECYEEILHIRHHSLFAPRDFDVSPYFKVIKPTIERGFDPHKVKWVT